MQPTSLPLIQRIPLSPPLFVPSTPDFESTAAEDLGNLGTAADGFDAIFAVPAGALDADLAGLAELDQLLADADFVGGALDTLAIAPLQADIASTQAEGEPTVGAIDVNPNQEGDPGGRPKPSVVGFQLARGYLFQKYSDQIRIFGGTPPMTFAITKGVLPNGLTMDDTGKISGTAEQANEFYFTVTATDAAGQSCTQQMEMLISLFNE